MRIRFSSLVLAALAATIASADDVPTTVAAAKRDVTFTVDAAGSFDATAPVEVAAKTQVYGDELEIEECAASGPVEKGAVLVRFKTDKIDEAIGAADRDLAVARALYAVQSEDQKRALAVTAAALVKAEFDARFARELLERFVKTDMPLRLEESEHNLQGTKNAITDQTEELAQLEKMYKGDDLTEETEEIVLKRSRRDLERTKKWLDFQTRRDAILRDSDIPRELKGLELESRRTAADFDRIGAVSKLQEAQAKLELDRAAANLAKQEKDVAKLKADRDRLTVAAPESGVAVPGALVRGKWQNTDEMRKALKKGAKFHGQDVLFTIVQPATRVVATVPEASVLALQVGQKARVAPNAAGDAMLDATLAYGAVGSNGTEFEVGFDLAKPDARIFPGMGCRVRVAVGSRPAVMIPSGAVEDGFEKAVYVLVDGKPQKRVVRTGATQDGAVEVVSGLADGERVLETPPKK